MYWNYWNILEHLQSTIYGKIKNVPVTTNQKMNGKPLNLDQFQESGCFSVTSFKLFPLYDFISWFTCLLCIRGSAVHSLCVFRLIKSNQQSADPARLSGEDSMFNGLISSGIGAKDHPETRAMKKGWSTLL